MAPGKAERYFDDSAISEYQTNPPGSSPGRSKYRPNEEPAFLDGFDRGQPLLPLL